MNRLRRDSLIGVWVLVLGVVMAANAHSLERVPCTKDLLMGSWLSKQPRQLLPEEKARLSFYGIYGIDVVDPRRDRWPLEVVRRNSLLKNVLPEVELVFAADKYKLFDRELYPVDHTVSLNGPDQVISRTERIHAEYRLDDHSILYVRIPYLWPDKVKEPELAYACSYDTDSGTLFLIPQIENHSLYFEYRDFDFSGYQRYTPPEKEDGQ